jgi:hypothetical protein
MNIIELAKEAGFDIDEGLFPFEASEDKFIGTERTLEAFAALVREQAYREDKSLTLGFEVTERKFVDLTDDEKVMLSDRLNLDRRIVVIDAVIAAFKEKNK